MKKVTYLFFSLSFVLFGMNYAKLKKHTLKHSAVLKSQALTLKQSKYENSIVTRTQNPTLGLSIEKFEPEFGSDAYGYEVTASQNIRTQSYMNGLEAQSYAKGLLSTAYATQGHASYIKRLEILYTQYVYEAKHLSLLKEEQRLSAKVTGMIQEHYENGSENKVAYLQAKTETLMLKTQIHRARQKRDAIHLKLLAMAGVRKKVSLQSSFIYPVLSKRSRSTKQTSKEKILLAKEELYASKLDMSTSTFDSYDLQAGIEKEPEQSILKLGISVALPVHNNKEEEKALARLQMQQLSLDKEQLRINVSSSKKILKNNLHALNHQYQTLKALQKEQQTLTQLLRDGYEISQSSLVELMREKARLIQTKKSLLNTHKMSNIQKIELRFLQGAYND